MPQMEVVALKGDIWIMDTTSIVLPPDMAPRRRGADVF